MAEAAFDFIPLQPILEELEFPPSLDYMKNINQMSAEKVPGKDGIPPEIHKAAGWATCKAFHNIITSMMPLWFSL